MVVHRHNLRSTIGSLANLLMKAPAPAELPATALVPAAPPRPAAAAIEADDDLAIDSAGAVHAE
jgi:acetyl-CoA carboxylase carboxyl transferase subunit beta